jgi:hypothetical protein
MSQVPIQFGGLHSSLDASKVPAGRAWESSNATVSHAALEGGPRWDLESTRTSPHAGDVGRGLFYFEYGTASEYLAFVKHNGEATVRAYSVSTAGVWTAITRGVAAALPDGQFYAVQFDAWIIVANASGMWMRRVGGAVGGGDADDAWKVYKPEYVKVLGAPVSFDRPSYATQTLSTSVVVTVVAGGSDTGFADPNPDADGNVVLYSGFNPADVDILTDRIVLTLTTSVDLSDVDYVAFRLLVLPDSGLSVPGSAGNWLGLSEDGTTALTLSFCDAMARSTETKVHNLGDDYWFRFYIGDIPNASKNAVLRLCWKQNVEQVHTYEARLSTITYGGSKIWDGEGLCPFIEYAYGYWNPTDLSLTTCIRGSMAATLGDGQTVGLLLEPLGSWPKVVPTVDAALNTAGWTKIRVYRKDHVDSGSWRQVAELNNTGTPSYRDVLAESELAALTARELTFDNWPTSIPTDCLAVWKQHLVLGRDRKLYFSLAGEPLRFVPPPEDKPVFTGDEGEDYGRTLFMSHGRTQAVAGAVGQDAFYALGPRGAYAMIGDFALSASPPRLLPGSKGAVGPWAFGAHGAGALVAAADGLWYMEVSRAFTGSEDNSYLLQELTKEVRGTYLWLLGNSPSTTWVATYEDEIWLFNAGRYMRLGRPRPDTELRAWESGTWPVLKGVSPVAGVGFRAMDSLGRILRVGWNSSAVAYTTDDGTAVNWTYKTGWLVGARRRITKIYVRGEGTPVITIWVDDGEKTPTPVATVLTKVALRHWQLPVVVPPGYSFMVQVAGVVGVDKVTDLVLVTEVMES